jgi:1,4-alpha-glucan branching enzyme
LIQKKYLAGKKVEVTFRMPPLDGVVELSLRGDFNDWAVKGVPLSQESDGGWVATLVLDAGRSYRYRYYDNQGSWHNDWEADGYVPNDYGSDDSVVDLTSAKEPSPGRGKQAAKPGPEAKSEAKPKATSVRPKKAAGGRTGKDAR